MGNEYSHQVSFGCLLLCDFFRGVGCFGSALVGLALTVVLHQAGALVAWPAGPVAPPPRTCSPFNPP